MSDRHAGAPGGSTEKVATDRESRLTDAFLSVVNSLADGFNLVDLHHTLITDGVRLLDVDAAVLFRSDAHDALQLVAASSGAIRELALLELHSEQGPCLDCFRSGTAVTVADLRYESARWPLFVAAATGAGFVSVHAVPMNLREHRLGALGLFATNPHTMSQEDLRIAQALAHVASVALVADRDRSAVDEQLRGPLETRTVIEQAKGLLAQAGDLTMDEAFQVLRRFARDHNQRLEALARLLVARDLAAAAVIAHARDRDVPPGPPPATPRPGPHRPNT